MKTLPLCLALAFGPTAVFSAGATTPPPAANPAPAATSSAATSTGTAPAAARPLTPRFQQVRDRIDALFRHRNATPEAPDLRFDPFRPAGAAPASPASALAGSEAGASALPVGDAKAADLALLQQGAATLKVNGIFEFGGRQHLVVNSRPYKQGDVIQTQVQGQTVYLRVKQIARGSLSLALNEAEMTLKF